MSTSSHIKHKPIGMTRSALAMFDLLSPEEASTTTVVSASNPDALVAATEPVKVTARLDSTVEGECPYCHSRMRTSIAANQQVWICDKDRHVVPLRNAEPA